MVLFTLTQPMVDGLNQLFTQATPIRTLRRHPTDPDLRSPRVGGLITHYQIVETWERLFHLHGQWDTSLEKFMKGSKPVFLPPPAAPAPTEEFKALMKKLRNEQDQKAYERILGRSSSLTDVKGAGAMHQESVAEFGKAMRLVGNMVFSLLGVPGAVFAILHSLCGIKLEWSMIMTAISFICTLVLELIILNQQEARLSVNANKMQGRPPSLAMPTLHMVTKQPDAKSVGASILNVSSKQTGQKLATNDIGLRQRR